ncbi:MAG: hypothetical protein ACM3H7_02355, partial [Acidobacteriaceae bacterium]
TKLRLALRARLHRIETPAQQNQHASGIIQLAIAYPAPVSGKGEIDRSGDMAAKIPKPVCIPLLP